MRILDERGRIDPTLGDHGESARTARDTVETARRFESLPEIAAAAYEGALSCGAVERGHQAGRRGLRCGVGAAGTERGAGRAGAAGAQRVEADHARTRGQRYEARSLRMWWTPDTGMLQLHGQLPDVMGATFEATIQQLTEQMKPAKGQRWDSFEHRAADALVSLCDQPEVEGRDADDGTAAGAADPRAPASARRRSPGIPIADSLLEQLRANATIEPVLVDDDGIPDRRSGSASRRLTEDRAGGAAARPLPLHRQLRRHLGPPDPSPSTTVLGWHRRHLRPDRHRQWPPPPTHPPRALRAGRQPQPPRGLHRVHLDDLTPQQRQQIGLPPPAPDRRPREEDEDVRCTSSRAPCALDARRRRRCRRARRRASG